ncbi:hypothetical protein BCSJ1_17690 [Bacillus cereus SJ1]|nr:hypothetical protein BCSJ1_17690 [Bacillus cereus SJ1]
MKTFTPINAQNVKKAHALLESGSTIGENRFRKVLITKKSDFSFRNRTFYYLYLLEIS